MANYFTLTRAGEVESSKFSRIDEEICRHMGAAVHETRWYIGWYDFFGLAIATGKTPEQMAGYLEDEDAESRAAGLSVLEYLRTYYEWDAWYSAGRH